MSVKLRQEIERKIATAIVLEALRLGFIIGIDNGGDNEEYRGSDEDAILKEMFATDDERLFFYVGKIPVGWVHLVYGNDGWDVISDYSANDRTETILKPAQALAETYQ